MENGPVQVMDLLVEIPLFSGLDERQIAHVAARTRIVNLAADEVLPLYDFEEDEDYPFYAVHSGKLCLSPTRWRSRIDEVLRKGDFFGADALFFGVRRNYRVSAFEPSILLRIESEVLEGLLVEFPHLKENLQDIVDVYRQVRSRRFEWLAEEEIVHLLTRKHPAHLLVSLVLPVLLFWLAVLIYIAASFIDISSVRLVMGWVAGLVLVAALLWAAWAYLDWRNDYYIVTDRRVVWLEHVMGLYDSRQEAPLTAIKSEEVKSTLIGRYLGYGSLLIHTLMGRISFRNIGAPEHVKAVIIEQQERASERQYEADLEAMDALLTRKMESQVEGTSGEAEEVPGEQPSAPPSIVVARPSPGLETLSNFFRTRVEANGTITYRKHIYILFRKVFWPSLLMLFVFLTNGYLTWQGINGPIILFLSAVILIGATLWWLYQFVDWRNDIYRVTFDKIIDSERKPLGSEVTKSAYLENILSLDYERLGLLGILLNFGNVIINVGTENKFIFWRIHNPARAQQDIFNRMYTNRLAKEAAEAAKDREHLADYIAVYNRRLRETQENPDTSNFDRESG